MEAKLDTRSQLLQRLDEFKQWDIVTVDLGEPFGHEQGGLCLAVIVSNNLGNKNSSILSIAPLVDYMRKKEKNLPMHVHMRTGLGNKTLMLEQMRVVDKRRVISQHSPIHSIYKPAIRKAIVLNYHVRLNRVPYEGNYAQGSIVWTNLSPVMGSEQAGERSVLIVSNDVGNRVSPIVSVTPLSMKVEEKIHRSFPLHYVIETELGPRVVLPEQTRILDKRRLSEKLTKISESQFQNIYHRLLQVYGI
ncbi:type II toxin-antitoxin system PemK/MazF family toxin [Paenibacillus hunanensis]|uniref:type II toxin-antitoxin system PemK/MazF family toxin n=1 Tax=Paenibacillus hunanensis TaxID=539262 RepID=UPI00202737D7|nr:type II toxin-antitoxin system PemK/MazF family toxin [Paenibacillus hunanensis]MCL9662115.1 type II toxin-antitoxin system PemK/MazF family toxin [Paenibacillus hunanensis]